MDCEHKLKVLEQEIESLKEENRLLKEKLSSSEKNFDGVSFKEKYAVRILDSLPDMLTVFNHEEMGIEVVSNEETNHVGVSNNDFKGMRMQDMVPKEAYHNIHNNLQKVISTGRGSTAHHELDVDGTLHYYENRIFPLDEEYVLIMCRDISERVATQQNLEIFKRILDRVSDSILAVSADGTLVYANRQFIEEYGVKGELGTQKIYDLPVSLNTKEQFDKRVQEIRDNGGNFAYRAKYTRVGETKLRVHQVSAFMIQNQGEEMIWFFTQDITDVIKNRDELRELNYLMDAILNNIPVYLFVKDPEDDFRYLYWNKAFASHSKIPASKALGRTDFEVFPEYENAEKFHRDDLELIRTRERMEMQETYVTATGEPRIVQTLKTLVPLEGRTPLIIGISWDITNIQNIEQELIFARIKAEQSDRLKTAFLANMSHEIRTPLNAIVGFSGILASTDEEEEKQEYVSIIENNNTLLLQLISDILDLSKIEAGTLEFQYSNIDLNKMLNELTSSLQLKIKSEKVQLTCHPAEENCFIHTEKNRLSQLLINLISNAIKFTTEGYIRFGYELRGKEIYFYVSDTGCGIPKDKQKSIFGRFVKLNSFEQGTGLGLSICQTLVEHMGGTIGVDSEEGKGSTFWFTLPYKAAIAVEESIKKEEIQPISIEKNKFTILIAEDNESNYKLFASILKGEYQLIHAWDGQEAVEMFKQYNPQIILMDINMPVMDGYEATKEIRKYSAKVPIIAITAFAYASDEQRVMESGFDGYMPKPINARLLKAQLTEIMQKRIILL